MPSVSLSTLTPLQEFVQRWGNCTRCFLHETRRKVVLFRGTVPADILFVGEAPGRSEDALGYPFVGPAGDLLDQIIMESVGEENLHRAADNKGGYTWAYTNLACCIPLTQDGDKAGEPPPEAITACAPRLEEFVKLCAPRLIVCVGALAGNWIAGTKGKRHLLTGYRGKLLTIAHPAALLRMPVAQRGLGVQRCVVQLRNAVEELG